jgi:flagellar motor switch protein FliG
MADELKGFELLKWQPIYAIIDALQYEHPQMITVALLCLDSDKSAQILQLLPQELSNNVIKRVTNLSPVSSFAMNTLSDYLEEQFTQHEKFKLITSDGVNIAANIISNMDIQSETEVMSYLTQENKATYERIQDKLFPFERLAKFDSRSMQTLMAEIGNDELVIALNGADDSIKDIFFKNMSAKSVDLLKDDLDSAGPAKPQDAIEAQKRIVALAKRLITEEKIYLGK